MFFIYFKFMYIYTEKIWKQMSEVYMTSSVFKTQLKIELFHENS